MANDTTIKGINIEFGANDANFNKSLVQINKELSGVGKLSKQIDKEISAAFDPNDLTPFQNKLVLVESELAGTESKLKAVEKEMSDMNEEAIALDPIKYQKLQTEASKARVSIKHLTDEQNRLNNDITALETEQYDELSSKTKKAAKSVGALTDEQLGYNKAASDTASINNEISTSFEDVSGAASEFGSTLSGIAIEGDTSAASMKNLTSAVMKLPGPLKIAGAAAAAFGAAAVGASQSSQMFSQMMMELAPTADATGVSLNLATEAANQLYIATGDLEGATTAVNAAMSAYGDTLNSATAMSAAAANMYVIQSNGILDVADASKIAQEAQEQFGASTLEANAAMFEAEQLMAQFPGQADDIADSMREFGDTLMAVGFDVNEFFTLLNVGLELGAKNTDELVNSINEMFIRVTEGSEEAIAALEAIGLSSVEMQEMIANGQGPEALMEILNALNDTTDATLQLTAATALFGTFGEEFIVPMLNSENQEFEKLTNTIALNEAATKNLSAVLAGDLAPTIIATAMAAGFSKQQAENLVIAYETLGLSALTATQKLIVLAAGFKVNGEAVNVSTEQQAEWKASLETLTDSTATFDEKLKALNGSFIEFLFSGALTEEQTKQVTEAFDKQKQEAIDLKAEYDSLGGAVGIFSQTLYDNFIAGTEVAESMDAQAFAALNYEDKIWALHDANVVSWSDAQDLIKQFGALKTAMDEGTVTTDQVTEAITSLTELGYKPNLEAIAQFGPALKEMEGGFDGSIVKSNDLTGEFAGMGKELDETTDKTDDFNEMLDDSNGYMGDAQKAARELENQMFDTSKAYDDATDSVNDLNAALQTNASLPPPQGVEEQGFFSFSAMNKAEAAAINQNQNQNENVNQNNVQQQQTQKASIENLTVNISGDFSNLDEAKLANKIVDIVQEKIGNEL